ncbi:MAG: nucleoside hydrolase [Actinomycetota bacterium]|nr:nucleoside hydrolase [Actinomycetota bacterium]
MPDLPIVVDCDTGVDDALALLYLTRQPEVDIVAAGCVHGNVPVAAVARNTLQVLALAGRADIPVAVGAARPLAQALHTSEAVHGGDGLGGAARDHRGTAAAGSAAEQLVRLARQRPGELSVLATGPLTNLALALLIEPRLPQLIRQVVVMGGAFSVPGNITPHAEANIFHDPEAAALVMEATWPVTVVGLDVTMATILGEHRLERLKSSPSTRARFSWQVLQHYLDVYEQRLGRRGCPVHDALAAAVLVHPALAISDRVPVHVELHGRLTRGATLIDNRSVPAVEPDRPAVSVVRQVDVDLSLDHLVDALSTE